MGRHRIAYAVSEKATDIGLLASGSTIEFWIDLPELSNLAAVPIEKETSLRVSLIDDLTFIPRARFLELGYGSDQGFVTSQLDQRDL